MVLFKRKPVQFLPKPTIDDDNSEVWVIPETNEVFTNYEHFLQRMNFYKQRRFICEITGHSSLTFFEALTSETEGSREVNSAFPEPLKEPVLRRVQFSTISRIDSLVDQVFEDFKQDFYPGERVTVLLTNGSRLHGIVREKARFPEVLGPGGIVERRACSRYLVKLLNRHNEEALLDDEHLIRDRKIFTKQMLRSFIKNTVTRESWSGAPWLVKPQIAEHFHIDTEVPKHLQYGNKAGKKANVSAEKEEDEAMFGFFASQNRPLNSRSGNKNQKAKSAHELAKAKEEQYLAYRRALNGNPSFRVDKKGHMKESPTYSNAHENSFHHLSIVIKPKSPTPPPPPIKYPIEDLDLPPVNDRQARPTLKFLNADEGSGHGSNIKMESIGPLLETWNTLNVYCEVFQLDSFTFDDFVQAIQFSSDDVDCELLVEMHCAVLKTLVNAESDRNGAVQISLPPLPEENDSDEEGEEETEAGPEPDPEPPRRTTRSSFAKAQAELAEIGVDQPNEAQSSEAKKHRADEMLLEYDWIDRLRKRDFKNGGWEIILVGLLNRLFLKPRLQNICEEILIHMAPLDKEPNQATAQAQYATLDVNLRIQILQIICMLTVETRAVKNYMEECSNQMTEFRKEKIELQRARKVVLEEIRLLHEERKQLEPDQRDTPVQQDEEMLEAHTDTDDTESDTDSDEPVGPSLRGGVDRAVERKRKQDAERERKEQATKQPKGSKQYQRVLKKMDDEKSKIETIESEIAVLDNDLREADCPRTRVLGKDRFWNRYYWFERNGMPYEGLPDSSTAAANYANGRLWVQGPDEMEREGFIDVPEEVSQEYLQRFGTTVANRKRAEEGPHGLSTAMEWGYYDTPEDLDNLMAWLDTRGVRELKLHKELKLQRNNIAKYMENRTAYLAEIPSTDEPQDQPMKGVATRTKVQANDHKQGHLRWHNLTALKECGHLHVESERPTKRTKKATGPDTSKEPRMTNRQGKPLGRQGTK